MTPDPSEIREQLEAHGLPPGLLPDSVAGVEIDEASGRFTVTLTGAVKRKVAGFTVLYDKTLTGTLSERRIAELGGVKVKVGLLKPAVTEIRGNAEKGKVSFGVAGIAKALPWSAFA